MYKNKETVRMDIISFTNYYGIEKFRNGFVRVEMQMGKRSVK